MSKVMLRTESGLSYVLCSIGMLAAALVCATSPVGGATILWDTLDTDGASGDGVTWGDTGNWIGGALPTSSDEVNFNGFAGPANVTGVHDFDGFDGGSGGSVTIASGGHLTTFGNFQAIRNLSAAGVVVNSGGQLTGDSNAERIRSAVTVNTGGLVDGFGDIENMITLDGGTFAPVDNAAASDFSISGGGDVLIASGVVQLDLFGDNSSDYFDVLAGGGVLDLVGTSGQIELILNGGYNPLPGHSFNLWDNPGGGTVTVLGDASNVTIPGESVIWDTSQWASDGILTIVAPPVPEPSSLNLMMIGASLIGMACRRRKRLRDLAEQF